MSNIEPILIVGAGPTGLTLALWLRRLGVSVRIIDTATGPGTTSRAMVVHARTLEFYRQLGLADDMIAEGIKTSAVEIIRARRRLVSLNFGDIGGALSPYPFLLTYPQDDHERFLIKALRATGTKVEWSTRLDEFQNAESGLRCSLTGPDGSSIIETPFLCGCDGAHSTVRQGANLSFEGGTYSQLFYVADCQVDGAPDSGLRIATRSGRFALCAPVRRSGHHRLIGIAPSELPQDETVTFDDVRPYAEQLLNIRVHEADWFSTYHAHHRIAEKFRHGNVFLLGDAAHIHSPAGGQGMNTGIGDSVNLAWKLAAVIKGEAPDALLDTYEMERQAFARELVSTTDRAMQTIISGSFAGWLVRSVLLPIVAPFAFGFPPPRELFFKTISQIRIAYSNSPLSVGRFGGLSGGDRLPWFPTPGGANYDTLRSLQWQIHIYGRGDPRLRKVAQDMGIPVHVFEWHESAGKHGISRNAAYLVRPDGYVAIASRKLTPALLRQYFIRWGAHKTV